MLAGDPATVGVAQPVVEGRRVGDGAAQRAEPRIVVDADHHAEIDLARSVLAGGDRHHIARGPHGRERLALVTTRTTDRKVCSDHGKPCAIGAACVRFPTALTPKCG
jgi:hypothetical protein